jgi:hypothetical protein
MIEKERASDLKKQNLQPTCFPRLSVDTRPRASSRYELRLFMPVIAYVASWEDPLMPHGANQALAIDNASA